MADIENNTGESPPLSQSAHSGADEYALPSKVRPEPSQSLNQQPNQSKTGNDSAEGVQDHHPSVERALEALTAAKITVVEYGAQPLYRFGSQEPLVLVEWLIPDESLIFASQILLEHDFPHILFPTEHGLWDRVQGALTHAVEGTELTRIQLVPLSLSGLKLSETIEVPSTFAPELRILSPKPPQYMRSLIEYLFKLKMGGKPRIRPESDLLMFISVYIHQDEPRALRNLFADQARGDLQQESTQDYQMRILEGIQRMQTWDWGDTSEILTEIAFRTARDCTNIWLISKSQEPEGMLRVVPQLTH